MNTPDIQARLHLSHAKYVEAFRQDEIEVFVNHPAIFGLCDTILTFATHNGIAYKSAKLWWWLFPVLSLLSVFVLGPFVILVFITAVLISIFKIGKDLRDKAFQCILEATLNEQHIYDHLLEQNILVVNKIEIMSELTTPSDQIRTLPPAHKRQHVLQDVILDISTKSEQKQPARPAGMATPTTQKQKNSICRVVLEIVYNADPNCREFLEDNGLTIQTVPFEDLIQTDIGLMVKLVELHIHHARSYPEHMHLMSMSEYLMSHVPMLNELHHNMYKAHGFDFPIDKSIWDIGTYISHFLHYRPDKGALSIPPHMISNLTTLLVDFYAGTPQNSSC